ncbi:hypothetical protein CFC21_110473 [Triticum aestivum]|uniref:Uncharacterized protein n=2 Tax=Triticum aestivum TaxID=4565 RepID=A0A9R1NE13_WHEAT|nr:uncharacterized protein LOC123166603 [Triticum aestivum]KAF7110353.1 hypothetical protein CFC21_110473 [Triticum aestivum]
MGASSVQCSSSVLALLLCSLLMHPSQAYKLHEEKVPLSFIVPDPSPVLSPPPVTGADDDDGMRPRLPTERWKRGRGEERRARGGAHAPAPAPWSAGPARAPAPSYAPAPDSGSGAPVIESSPAVPVPRGVRDTATILPMPAPGVKRQDVGGAALARPGMAPLVVGLVMMASLGALLC